MPTRGVVRTLATVWAAVALLLVGGCASSPADESEVSDAAPTGSIVFLRSEEPGGSGDLLATELRSGETDLLARDVESPSVSADGSAILFARERTWWLRREGSAARQVIVGRDDGTLVLSPDARTIYFTRLLRDDGGYAVASFAMRPDGTRVRQVTRPRIWEDGTCDADPAPLANGGLAYTRIADCRRGAERSVELLARDGRPVEVLRHFDERGDFWLAKPAVSADGAWISFVARNVVPGPGAGRYAAAVDGTNAHRVGTDGSAAWSPDGHWLAFAEEGPAGAGDVWIVRRDGSARRRLTSTPAHEVVLAWLAGQPP